MEEAFKVVVSVIDLVDKGLSDCCGLIIGFMRKEINIIEKIEHFKKECI